MKTKNIFLFGFVFIFFILSSCGGGGIKDMDNEPNNKVTEAVALPMDTSSFISHIQENGDYDWFKIEIPEQGYYNIASIKSPEGLHLQVRFATYNPEESNKEKYISDWFDLPAIMHFPAKGIYYYVLHDDFDDASSKEDIVLKPKFTPEFDKYEMNDKAKDAKEMGFDQEFEMYIYPAYDFDWFKMKIDDKKGYLKTSIAETHEGVNLQIKFAVKNPDGNDYITVQEWSEFPVAVTLPDADELYFYIHDDYEDAYSKEPYSVKLTYLPEMDKYEPNNTYKQAKDAAVGDTLDIAIYPKNDFDWFKLTTNAGDSIKFIVQDVEGAIHPQIKIYTLNEEGNDVQTYRDWQDFPYAVTMEGTEYYLQIHDDYEDARSEKTFKFIIKKVE